MAWLCDNRYILFLPLILILKVKILERIVTNSSKCKRQLRKSNLAIGMLKFSGFNSFFLKWQTEYLKEDCPKCLTGLAAWEIAQMEQVPKSVTLCLPSSRKLGRGRGPRSSSPSHEHFDSCWWTVSAFTVCRRTTQVQKNKWKKQKKRQSSQG